MHISLVTSIGNFQELIEGMSFLAQSPKSASSMTSEVASSVATAVTSQTPLMQPALKSIFLQTKFCQAIAGVCVWTALFLTCQQVNTYSLS